MSWKPRVQVLGDADWNTNGLVFATEAEAVLSAHDLACRWYLVREWGAFEVDSAEYPVNYKWTEKGLEAVKENENA